jgi:hypothetical protein
MGVLIAKKYPTILVLRLADHTYVECGSGTKAWGCWGGKTRGRAFKSGAGSTNRADSIAQPNERAGIRRYLIDGVCHQAANRILLPAGLTVAGARGYDLSACIFGAMGRCGLDAFPNKTGDLPECLEKAGVAEEQPVLYQPESDWLAQEVDDLRRLWAARPGVQARFDFNVGRFLRDVDRLFQGELSGDKRVSLIAIKADQERRLIDLEDALEGARIDPVEFIREFNKMTGWFQVAAAETLDADEYRLLLGEDRGSQVLLADPDGIDAAYGEGTAVRVYDGLR